MPAFKLSEWQTASSKWYCNDTTNLNTEKAKWYYIPRKLGISLPSFVELLINKYKVDNISFNGETLVYSWNAENYRYCHTFVLEMNAKAKKGGW